jgi:GNAT superfamily N-acetyltransferase
MDRLSSEINFPGDPFCEDAFRVSLRSDVRHGDVYIYEDDEGLIGWLWLDIDVRHHSAHIKHIQVEQARWGQGYGRRIVQDAMAIAGHAACRVLTLNVTKSNARAMALMPGSVSRSPKTRTRDNACVCSCRRPPPQRRNRSRLCLNNQCSIMNIRTRRYKFRIYLRFSASRCRARLRRSTNEAATPQPIPAMHRPE